MIRRIKIEFVIIFDRPIAMCGRIQWFPPPIPSRRWTVWRLPHDINIVPVGRSQALIGPAGIKDPDIFFRCRNKRDTHGKTNY